MLNGFMHICTINHWKEIVDEQLQIITSSGVFDKLDNIFCGVVGEHEFYPPHPKIKVVYRSYDIREYEYATLQWLHTFCKNTPPRYIFYIHTKGVSSKGGSIENPPEIRKFVTGDYRKFMQHILFNKHIECLEALKKADICGVNWRMYHNPPYLAGNFWWARTEYIATLPRFTQNDRNKRSNAEFWIGKGTGVAVSMWKSRKNIYGGRYCRHKHINQRQSMKFYHFNNKQSEPLPIMEIPWLNSA